MSQGSGWLNEKTASVRGDWITLLAGGKVERYSCSGKQFGSFFKDQTRNYQMTQQLHSWALTPEKWRLLCSHRNLHTNVKQSFICSSQNLEPSELSFDRWMVKQTVVCPHHGMLLSDQRKGATGAGNNGAQSPEIMLSGKSQSRKITCCGIAFMRHSLNDKIMERENVWLPGLRRRWGQERGICDCQGHCGNDLFLDCIDVSILVVISWYCRMVLQDITWGKLGTLVLSTAYESTCLAVFWGWGEKKYWSKYWKS